MNHIPTKVKTALSNDPFMKACCLTQDPRAEWHNVWTYKGKQIQEVWAIVPLSLRKHRIGGEAFHNSCKDTIEQCQIISLTRCKSLGMWDEMLKKYPRRDWNFIYNSLIKKRGAVILWQKKENA